MIMEAESTESEYHYAVDERFLEVSLFTNQQS